MARNISILFEADLGAVLRGRGFMHYQIRGPKFAGVFVSADDPNLGQVAVEYVVSLETAADYPPERAVHTVSLFFSRFARHSLALRRANSRCHQFVRRYPKPPATPLLLRLLPAGAFTGWGLPPPESATSAHRASGTVVPVLLRFHKPQGGFGILTRSSTR